MANRTWAQKQSATFAGAPSWCGSWGSGTRGPRGFGAARPSGLRHFDSRPVSLSRSLAPNLCERGGEQNAGVDAECDVRWRIETLEEDKSC